MSQTDPLARAREVHETATPGRWRYRDCCIREDTGIPRDDQDIADVQEQPDAPVIAFEHNTYAAFIEVADTLRRVGGALTTYQSEPTMDAVRGWIDEALDRLYAVIEKEST